MPSALSFPGPRISRALALAGICLILGGCSIRKLAINAVADTLAGGASVFAQDEDPELVAQALPFALKTLEALLAEAPENRNLLLSACSGFTQYAYAFVETEAFFVEPEDFRQARRLRKRALRLYLRGRDYCVDGLETLRPEIRRDLVLEPEGTAASLGRESLDLIYWTAASWGAAISVGLDRPELVADLPVVRSLLERAVTLDETFQQGALHEAMIALAALPEALGGSQQQARTHFERAGSSPVDAAPPPTLRWPGRSRWRTRTVPSSNACCTRPWRWMSKPTGTAASPMSSPSGKRKSCCEGSTTISSLRKKTSNPRIR